MDENSNNAELRRQIKEMEQSFVRQGILDRGLIGLSEVHPEYVEKNIIAYLEDSLDLLDSVWQQLKNDFVYFPQVEELLEFLSNITCRIGAMKVEAAIFNTKEFRKDRNIRRSLTSFKVAFRQLQEEHASVTVKLEAYLELLRQAHPAPPA